jgi:hypothetical protein
MLARADWATTWGCSEPKPITYAARRAELAPAAALEPAGDSRDDVPAVVLVAGAGYLGTGTTPASLERWESSSNAFRPSSRPVSERRLRLV